MRGMSEEDYISTTDAAAHLGITRQRVLQLIEAGRLPAKLFANVYMIRVNDLSLVEERTPGRPPGKVSTANKAATAPANGSNAALTAAKAKKKGKK
jgi:excisionase family DNA binding protein